ncbi:hypothetical protein TGGT1_214900 [Toxoplasma gondii GT1]|uniref:Transmembrane protein n=2 Tax=Toxoplasma gondii TaxID=5811 RepID=S7UQH5_TOXGG|nr:hypothetical protein TGGT1_214900 [Toxoplasma gondii GT1]KAF4640046.1 hypothetical protein TGRH88_039710 [Toxoplasma gondii]
MGEPRHVRRTKDGDVVPLSLFLHESVAKKQGRKEQENSFPHNAALRSSLRAPRLHHSFQAPRNSPPISLSLQVCLFLCVLSVLSSLPLVFASSRRTPLTGATPEFSESEATQRLPTLEPRDSEARNSGLHARRLSPPPDETSGDTNAVVGEPRSAAGEKGVEEIASLQNGARRDEGEGEPSEESASLVNSGSLASSSHPRNGPSPEEESRGDIRTRETTGGPEEAQLAVRHLRETALKAPSRPQSDGVEAESRLQANRVAKGRRPPGDADEAPASSTPVAGPDPVLLSLGSETALGASVPGHHESALRVSAPSSGGFSAIDAVTLLERKMAGSEREGVTGETPAPLQGPQSKREHEVQGVREPKEIGGLAGKKETQRTQAHAEAKKPAEKQKEKDRGKATAGKRAPEKEKLLRVRSEASHLSRLFRWPSRGAATQTPPSAPGAPRGATQASSGDNTAGKRNDRALNDGKEGHSSGKHGGRLNVERRRHSAPPASFSSPASNRRAAPQASGAVGASASASASGGSGNGETSAERGEISVTSLKRHLRQAFAFSSPNKSRKDWKRENSATESGDSRENRADKAKRVRKQEGKKKSLENPSEKSAGKSRRRNRERRLQTQRRRQQRLPVNQLGDRDDPTEFASYLSPTSSSRKGRGPGGGRNGRQHVGHIAVEEEGRVSLPASPVASSSLPDPSTGPRRRRRGAGQRDFRYDGRERAVRRRKTPERSPTSVGSGEATPPVSSGIDPLVPGLEGTISRPTSENKAQPVTPTASRRRRRYAYRGPGKRPPTVQMERGNDAGAARDEGDKREEAETLWGGKDLIGKGVASLTEIQENPTQGETPSLPDSRPRSPQSDRGGDRSKHGLKADRSGSRGHLSHAPSPSRGLERGNSTALQSNGAEVEGSRIAAKREGGADDPLAKSSRIEETEAEDEQVREKKKRGGMRSGRNRDKKGKKEGAGDVIADRREQASDNSDDGPGDHFWGPPGDGVAYLFSPENRKRLCHSLYQQPDYAEMFVVLFLLHLRWPSYTQQEGGTSFFFKTLQAYTASLVDGQSPANFFSLLRDCPLHEISNQVISSLTPRIQSRTDLQALAEEMIRTKPPFFAYSLAYTAPASKTLRTSWGFFATLVVVWEVFATGVLRDDLFGLSSAELNKLQKNDPFFWAALAEGLLDVWSMQRAVNTSLLWTYMTVSSLIDTGPTSRVQNSVGILLLEDMGSSFGAFSASSPFVSPEAASKPQNAPKSSAEPSNEAGCSLLSMPDLSDPAALRALQEVVEKAIRKKLEQAVDKRVAPVAGCRRLSNCLGNVCEEDPVQGGPERGRPMASPSPFIQYSSCETLWRRVASHLPFIQVTGFYMRRSADPRRFFPQTGTATHNDVASSRRGSSSSFPPSSLSFSSSSSSSTSYAAPFPSNHLSFVSPFSSSPSPPSYSYSSSSPVSSSLAEERGLEVGDFGSEVPQAILQKMKADLPAGGILVQLSLVDAWGSHWYGRESQESVETGDKPEAEASNEDATAAPENCPEPLECSSGSSSPRCATPVYVPATTAMELFRVDLSVDPSLESVPGRVSALAVEVIGIDSIDVFEQGTDPRRDPDVHVYLSVPEVEFYGEQEVRDEIYTLISGQPSDWVAAAMRTISWDRVQVLGTARWTGLPPSAGATPGVEKRDHARSSEEPRETWKRRAETADSATSPVSEGPEQARYVSRQLGAGKRAGENGEEKVSDRQGAGLQGRGSAGRSEGGVSGPGRDPVGTLTSGKETRSGDQETATETDMEAEKKQRLKCSFGRLEKTRGFGKRYESTRTDSSTEASPSLPKTGARVRSSSSSSKWKNGRDARRADGADAAPLYGSDEVLAFGWQPGHLIVHVLIEGLAVRYKTARRREASADDLILEMTAEEAKLRLTRRIRGRDTRVVHVHLDHRNIELADVQTPTDHPRSDEEEEGVPITTAVLSNVFLAVFMILVLTCLHLVHKQKKGPFWLLCCCGGEFPWLAKKKRESKLHEQTGMRSERSLETTAPGTPCPPKAASYGDDEGTAEAEPIAHAFEAAEADLSTYGASQHSSMLLGSPVVSPRESLFSGRDPEVDEESVETDRSRAEPSTLSPVSPLRIARLRASPFSNSPTWHAGDCDSRRAPDNTQRERDQDDAGPRAVRFRRTSVFGSETAGPLGSMFSSADIPRVWDAWAPGAGPGGMVAFESPRRAVLRRCVSAIEREDSTYSASVDLSSLRSSSSSSVEIYDSTPSLRRSASCRTASRRFSIRESLPSVHLRWNYFSPKPSSPISADSSAESEGAAPGRRTKR